MEIRSLHLENYRCFDKLDIVFDSQLTVLVGDNGSGKTAILDAVAYFLMQYANISGDKSLSQVVSDIKIGEKHFILRCMAKDKGFEEMIRKDTVESTISFPNGHVTQVTPDNAAESLWAMRKPPLSHLHEFYQNARLEDVQCPIVVSYSAKRVLNTVDMITTDNNELQNKQLVGVSPVNRRSFPSPAYANAFFPQIDFSSSLTWFIEKANEEGRTVKRNKDVNYTIPELDAVRRAISQALGDYGEPYVDETPPQLLIPEKGDIKRVFRIEQLSDGYRTMLALVMDLARRMAVANEHVKWEDKSVLYSPGIVLIDEVELHLHPSWQQTVLPTLMKIFPNTQFIVTTHSPQVLTTVAAKHIRVLERSEEGFKAEPPKFSPLAQESGDALARVMGVQRQPELPLLETIHEYEQLVREGRENSIEARDHHETLVKAGYQIHESDLAAWRLFAKWRATRCQHDGEPTP